MPLELGGLSASPTKRRTRFNSLQRHQFMKRQFKAYKFRGRYRVRRGSARNPKMDLSLSCKCAGCIALWLNWAYEQGFEDGSSRD